MLADAAMRALAIDASGAGAELSMPERCVAIEVGARRGDGDDGPANGYAQSGS